MSFMTHAGGTFNYGAGMSAPGGGGHADVARVFGLGLGDAVSCVFGIYDPGILRCGWDTHRRKC